MRLVVVRTPAKCYEIRIENQSFAKLPRLIQTLTHGPIVLITDTTVGSLYGVKLAAELKEQGREILLLTIPDGESSKTLPHCEQLYTRLIESRVSRDAVILALGGGVVGDLAGFVASTYLRGIPLIQIPTTLLAQVDSSVGGKVGVNHPLGKNLIGAFYHPDLVLIDPDMLTTLELRERLAGLGEIVKYALIKDVDLLALLENKMPQIAELQDFAAVEQVIARCCQIKADIVQEDERESGVRAWLNFGHTIGHALEAATGYEYFRHGEAVARGMVGALHLSASWTGLTEQDLLRSLALIRLLDPPPVPEHITVSQIQALLLQDKKRRSSGQIWVLLTSAGSAVLRNDVPEKLVSKAIEQACLTTF